jgi:hypothetical protein
VGREARVSPKEFANQGDIANCGDWSLICEYYMTVYKIVELIEINAARGFGH